MSGSSKKDMKMPRPVVAILMGSDSDWPAFEPAAQLLKEFGIGYDVHALSAHRTPGPLKKYLSQAGKRGTQVFIAGAGGAAHLAGVVAAHTISPVIGVPIETKLSGGLDSLLSTVQMPRGIPVATVAVGNGYNAALLAVQILAVGNRSLQRKLAAFKQGLAAKVLKADRKLQEKL
jgi:5-(carboxyamino)imidazole ribonucleotide mutase